MDVGDALRGTAEDRIDDAVGKYFDGGYSGHVTFTKEGSGFRAECMVHLDTGTILQASGSAGDAHASFDSAAEKIEKRLRRYKRRLKDHHSTNGKANGIDIASYVLQQPDDEEELPVDYNPVIIAENSTTLSTLSVGEAVMELDLTEAPIVVFRNAGNGGVNVVYRRPDGNVGWVDPTLTDQ